MVLFSSTVRPSNIAARLSGFEQLEERDQPSAVPLGNLNTVGSPAFLPLDFSHTTASATLGNRIYFLADNGAFNPALYSSDGTSAGTALVRGIAPENNSPLPSGWDQLRANTTPVVLAGGKLYFVNPSSASGLWVSDGTKLGTVSVPFPAGSTSGGPPTALYPTNRRLVFTTSLKHREQLQARVRHLKPRRVAVRAVAAEYINLAMRFQRL